MSNASLSSGSKPEFRSKITNQYYINRPYRMAIYEYEKSVNNWLKVYRFWTNFFSSFAKNLNSC